MSLRPDCHTRNKYRGALTVSGKIVCTEYCKLVANIWAINKSSKLFDLSKYEFRVTGIYTGFGMVIRKTVWRKG